jgi:hypothetical protein
VEIAPCNTRLIAACGKDTAKPGESCEQTGYITEIFLEAAHEVGRPKRHSNANHKRGMTSFTVDDDRSILIENCDNARRARPKQVGVELAKHGLSNALKEMTNSVRMSRVASAGEGRAAQTFDEDIEGRGDSATRRAEMVGHARAIITIGVEIHGRPTACSFSRLARPKRKCFDHLAFESFVKAILARHREA